MWLARALRREKIETNLLAEMDKKN
jgi:hypothetical protein